MRDYTSRHGSDDQSIVLIAYHFPPDPAVGSQRAGKVARAFRDAGYRVDVVTAQLPGEELRPRRMKDPALVVHPVRLLPSPRELVARLNVLLSPRLPSPRGIDHDTQRCWVPPTQIAGWKRLLFSLLWLPDDRQGFILPAWRKARSLVRAGARLVYSTAPPSSPHLVALALKSITRVRWVMELLDTWADNDQKPSWVRTRAIDAVDARLERLCLRSADLVVAVSDGIGRRLAQRLSLQDASRLLVVRNGIDHLSDSTRSRRNSGPLRITYAGTFYYGRDPRPFLRGLAAVCRKQRLGAAQVRVDFLGACRSIGAVSVQKEIDALELTDVVQIHDWLPQATAKAFVDEADVLLLLAQQQPDQVPNKLYEYLGTRRPILAFADKGGETARMLQRVGGHYVITREDEVEVERVLRELITCAGCGSWVEMDETVLKEWTTEAQMKNLLMDVRE